MVSLTTFVPPYAIAASGLIGDTNDDTSDEQTYFVAGTSAGMGETGGGSVSGIALFNDFSASIPYDAPLVSSQTLYWKSSTTDNIVRMILSGYTLNF